MYIDKSNAKTGHVAKTCTDYLPFALQGSLPRTRSVDGESCLAQAVNGGKSGADAFEKVWLWYSSKSRAWAIMHKCSARFISAGLAK